MEFGSGYPVHGARTVALILLLFGLVTATAVAGYAASDEARTEAYFESIRKDPNLLLAFLHQMPKGADLHIHLFGSVYAESLIQWAAEAKDCVDPAVLNIVAGPCHGPEIPVSKALADPALYSSMIDAFSMRNWQPSRQSGHDHFFDTLNKIGQATEGAGGKMLAETASRAASQHEIYQELMLTPTGKDLETLAKSLGWDDDFGQMQQKLLENGLPQILGTASQWIRTVEASRDKILNCSTAKADPGCQIKQRFLFQVSRGKPKEVVFAQVLSSFLMAGADPKLVPLDPAVVGLNLMMAEDWYVPMQDFRLHMLILDYFHKKYPQVHIALHAGELVEGLVPAEDLQFHVRDSVEIGHAERIGHGVDVMNETRPLELMHEMAAHNVMVEICLTSNDVVLGVRGPQHPLREYIRANVPVALATDKEGVTRSDMTHEYLKGVEEQDLSYLQLKKMARTSLEHAFISGASLWRDGNSFTLTPPCVGKKPGGDKPSAACQKLLDGSEKARLQWKLESDFQKFESQAGTGVY
jgi:hypothetical protein